MQEERGNIKRSVTLACLLISLSALFIVSAVGVNMIYSGNVGSVSAALKNLAYSMSFSSGSDYENLASQLSADISGSPVRVTYISSSGLVVGDSGDYSAGERVSFTEVTDALNTGYGESHSGSLTQCRFACAVRLSNGSVLRLFTTADCLAPALSRMVFPFLLGVFLILILLPVAWSVVLGHVFTVCQSWLDSLKAALSGRNLPVLSDEDELKPIFHSINEKTCALMERYKKAENGMRAIEDILNSMNEGLVVLDSQQNILMINDSASDYFQPQEEITGQNLLRLTHHAPIISAVNDAAKNGVHGSVDFTAPKNPNKILQVFISPVRKNKNSALNGGIILLFSDVTSIRKTERIRSDFVANASHELKTPLTTIKGFAELIDSEMITDPEQISHYLRLIKEESDRLILLIGDILRLSELEAQSIDTGISAVSLKLTAEKAAQSLRNQALEKGISLNVSGDAGLYHANPDRMLQVMLNLIENAVKYNKPGGSVNIKVSNLPRYVEIQVADTGIGIPAEDRERVFERFYRVDRSHSRKIPGTGLGLSIVKHIVELYKGVITLDSDPGKGTAITVKLPLE